MLKSNQINCVKLMVQGDKTQKEIAEELKVSQATICNWKKNKEFHEEYRSSLTNSMSFYAAVAFKELACLATHAKSEMVRFYACKDILDRTGFKEEENINIKGVEPIVIVNDLKE